MKRKFFVIAAACILLFALSGGTESYAKNTGVFSGSPGFTVDGKAVAFDADTGFPYLTGAGRTMMPVRVCLDSVGCEVDWDGKSGMVLTRKGETKVDIPVGQETIYVDGKAVPIDAGAVLKNGRTYLPLRAVLEAYGYQVDWDGKTGIVSVSSADRTAPSPFNINGGTTGIFSRKQLSFDGFSGIQADVTLPMVSLAEKGDCPYVYFGFDWANDVGNAEGGFQFIEDPGHPGYDRWTVFLRQGNDWRWGQNIVLEQGSTHHLKFYSEKRSEQQTDLVIELDGKEVVRKSSAASDFSKASVKAVVSMAMSKPFDGANCLSRSEGAKIANLKVLKQDQGPFSDQALEQGSDSAYTDFGSYKLYQEWRPSVGAHGMWYGTADCIPSYLHFEEDGTVSIYKGQ